MLRLGQLLVSFGGCVVLAALAFAAIVSGCKLARDGWRERTPVGVGIGVGLGLFVAGTCLWAAALLWRWPA